MEEIPEARPADVEMLLAWRLTEGGALRGELSARNVTEHAVRLVGKPGVRPVGRDGVPLDTQCVITLEWKPPGYVVVEPGQRAVAHVSWAGWDGPPAGSEVLVQLEHAEQEVPVHVSGPRQPNPLRQSGNLTSSWFELRGE